MSADEQSDFGVLLGFRLMEAGEGRVLFELPLAPRHRNRYGTVHGGVLMTLADAAGLWAGAFSNGTLQPTATVSLTSQFLRAARGDVLHAEGRLVKAGRTVFFSEVRIATPCDGALVATASGVFAPLPDTAPRTLAPNDPVAAGWKRRD